MNDPNETRRAALSAAMDGDPQSADEACRAWRDDAQSREDWHTYHLIGDLLRSDEHRCDPSHDVRFLARLRERLEVEPVAQSPQPVVLAASRRRAAWRVPVAVAAGFVAVAGALMVIRTAGPEGAVDGSGAFVASTGAAPLQRVAATGAGGPASAPAAESATMIRNAELDRYLAAHRQFANASTLAAPGAVVRSVAVAAPGR